MRESLPLSYFSLGRKSNKSKFKVKEVRKPASGTVGNGRECTSSEVVMEGLSM